MSFTDFLFGGQDTRPVEWQSEVNRDIQEYTKYQNELARADAWDLFGLGNNKMNQGYSAAIDVARQAPQTQGNLLARASQQAQGTLLGGMDEYRRAIMGMPLLVDGSQPNANSAAWRPQALGSNAAQAVFRGQDPRFLTAPPAAPVSRGGDQQMAAAPTAPQGAGPIQVPWGTINWSNF